MDTAPLVAAFRHYLDVQRDPSNGGELYDAYAPDAPLCIRFEVVPRHALERAEFAHLMSAGARHHAKANPGQPRRPDLIDCVLLSAEFEGDRAVAWFQAREASDWRQLCVAVGMSRVNDTWKIHWATFAPEVTSWGFAEGLERALKYAPVAAAGKLSAPRGWLDLAYCVYAGVLDPRDYASASPGWRLLGNANLEEIQTFLQQESLANIDLLGLLALVRKNGADLSNFGWYGWYEDGAWRALCTSRDVLLYFAPDPAHHEALAAFLAARVHSAFWTLGLEPQAGLITERLRATLGSPSVDHLHHLMTLEAADLICPTKPGLVRYARLDELQAVAAIDAEMVFEELGYDQLAGDNAWYWALLTQRINDGHIFVYEEEGVIRFQVSLGCICGDTASVTNGWTPLAFRGQGYARRGYPQACALALARFTRLHHTIRVNNGPMLAIALATGWKYQPRQLREIVWRQ